MPAIDKVTVGMPVYNDPSGLLRSVPTVFNQTWDGVVRLLIVDDGSTDETPEVIAALRDVYGGIDVIRNDDNRGRPFARNQILDSVDSDYLAWLDSGDLWHPRKLEIQFEVLSAAEEESDQPVLCTTAFRWVFADTGQERIKIPEVSGDQLHNALTSTLPPYLWTLLGRTSAFHSAGRFDERLPRRQDYEFFVRFIERGGRVVATQPNLPLATYMKTDVGRAPGEVAAANRVIRQLHRHLYARYGRGFARQMRRRQLVLEARFYENNGKRTTAVAHRAMGWLWAPSLTSLRGTRTRLKRWLRRARTAGLRILVRGFRPILPLLRRIGFTSLLRRVANPEQVIPGYYQELERGLPPASEVADELETAVATEGGTASVATWLQLEEAYLRGGLLDSAQSALERGRRQHPGSGELEARIVELLALRRRWVECVRLWMSLSPVQIEAATPTTYSRVAWAYRELDQPDESLLVLDAGLSRWPNEHWLLEQLHKSRARGTDWKRVMEAEDVSAPGDPATPPGLVTDLGFLSGEHGPIRGWAAAVGVETNVHLMVNGTPVASTNAAPAADGHRTFSFNSTELMEFLGDGDVVTVESEGQPLPIEGGGERLVFRPGHESRFSTLQQRLAQGFVFENLGKFVEGNTPRRKTATLGLYEEVRRLIRDEGGYELYPIYGNLLGAIRDNDFIAHDVGGFDVVYVSRHRSAPAVRREFDSICRMLVDNGYHLKVKPWSAYIRLQRSGEIFVDLNYAWFNTHGELNISYGWRHTPVTDPTLLALPREAPLGSHWVPVPGNAEAVLTQIYGPTWVTPNQGYVPDDELRRDENFLLTDSEMAAISDHNEDLVEIASQPAGETRFREHRS
jgi:glycosyltransferase involved in cell wall biosynthesis